MIFHVLNQSHKRTHAIQADAFRVFQHTTDSMPKPAVLHSIIEFYTHDIRSHWWGTGKDDVHEVVVARIKTVKDYTVIAEHAIDRPMGAPKP